MRNPFQAFYWPGGQSITRYILDNRIEFSGKTVFDFGAGCGSASIASAMVGARPIANDIDSGVILEYFSRKIYFENSQLLEAYWKRIKIQNLPSE